MIYAIKLFYCRMKQKRSWTPTTLQKHLTHRQNETAKLKNLLTFVYMCMSQSLSAPFQHMLLKKRTLLQQSVLN